MSVKPVKQSASQASALNADKVLTEAKNLFSSEIGNFSINISFVKMRLNGLIEADIETKYKDKVLKRESTLMQIGYTYELKFKQEGDNTSSCKCSFM